MLGPVQVLVVAVPDDDGDRAVFQSLAAVLDDGPVRWLHRLNPGLGAVSSC